MDVGLRTKLEVYPVVGSGPALVVPCDRMYSLLLFFNPVRHSVFIFQDAISCKRYLGL